MSHANELNRLVEKHLLGTISHSAVAEFNRLVVRLRREECDLLEALEILDELNEVQVGATNINDEVLKMKLFEVK